MVYPSGNSYEGEWADDQKSGAGVMRWDTLGQAYCGRWARDLPNGLGEHTWEADGAPQGGHATCLMNNRWKRLGGSEGRGPNRGFLAQPTRMHAHPAPTACCPACHAQPVRTLAPSSAMAVSSRARALRPMPAPLLVRPRRPQVPRAIPGRPPPWRGRTPVRLGRALRGRVARGSQGGRGRIHL
jgi:hypothetical protein